MFTNQNKFSCVLVLMSLACAVEPSVKQTANQRVAFEEDENPHLPTNAKAKESDAKPEVRVKEKSEEKIVNLTAFHRKIIYLRNRKIMFRMMKCQKILTI